MAEYASLCSSPWAGVACAPDKRTVVSLDISGYNVSGSLSPAIGGLVHLEWLSLRHLNLSNNQLNGSLVTVNVSAMARLEVLDVYDNDLTGPLPGAFPAGLRQLLLRQHPPDAGRVEGHGVPVGGLGGAIPRELGNLFLGHFFSSEGGGIPAELGQLRKLVHLDLAICGLQGPIPAELGALGSLDTLYLQTNQLSNLNVLPSLTYLDLSSNALSGAIPVFRILDYLNVSWNMLNGSIPRELGAMHRPLAQRPDNLLAYLNASSFAANPRLLLHDNNQHQEKTRELVAALALLALSVCRRHALGHAHNKVRRNNHNKVSFTCDDVVRCVKEHHARRRARCRQAHRGRGRRRFPGRGADARQDQAPPHPSACPPSPAPTATSHQVFHIINSNNTI